MAITNGNAIVASDMNLMVPIGVPLPFFGTVTYLPSGHLILDGTTIGDGSSGGTARANADTVALFTLLWNSIAQTELPIQNSSGAGSTRGANAAADYAAHKRLPLPDMRAYTLAGYKSADGNFGTLGKTVGEATHQLTVAELAAHTHALSTATNFLGQGGGNAGYSGSSSGVLNTLNNAGSDTAHNNVQPTMTVNWIIRYTSFA
jgi:microcystin-dependent protein